MFNGSCERKEYGRFFDIPIVPPRKIDHDQTIVRQSLAAGIASSKARDDSMDGNLIRSKLRRRRWLLWNFHLNRMTTSETGNPVTALAVHLQIRIGLVVRLGLAAPCLSLKKSTDRPSFRDSTSFLRSVEYSTRRFLKIPEKPHRDTG